MPQSPSTKPSIPRFNQLKWKMAGAGILVGLTSGLDLLANPRNPVAVGAVVRCGCRSGRAYCVDDCQGADGVR